MKVVLFAGGLGTRLREYDETVPKPMVTIGYRPIMWHLMRYYAHFGHKEFILCLGYKAEVIKKYFLEYNEAISNDFVLLDGGRRMELLNSDIQDWKITFVDTGPKSPMGERLRQVKHFVAGDEIFLANYTDCLTDIDLHAYVDHFRKSGKVAAMLTVPPNVSFHYVAAEGELVTSLTDVQTTPLRVNGGFFAFRQEIFDYLEEGDELVDAPFHRLIERQLLLAYQYNGFWRTMDTFKDKQYLDELVQRGTPPWALWRKSAST